MIDLFRLRVLSSGVRSFELRNRNEKKDMEEISALVSDEGELNESISRVSFAEQQVEKTKSMSADQLANQLGIPVIVARERYSSSFKRQSLALPSS